MKSVNIQEKKYFQDSRKDFISSIYRLIQKLYVVDTYANEYFEIVDLYSNFKKITTKVRQ